MLNMVFYEGKDHFEEPYSVREAVFMIEQGFENEIDEIDNTCTHCVIFDGDKAVACGRFFSEKENEATIGRIAVLKDYRKKHLGKMVMDAIEKEIAERGYKTIGLSAQCQAQGFYEKCGYHAEGDIYMDEHCEHIHMVKQVK